MLKDLEDPELCCLVQSLSAAVVGSEQMLQQRNTWGGGGVLPEMDDMNREVTHIPCQSRASSTNIWGGSGSVQSKAAVEEAVHALSWLHEVAGLDSVATAHIVQTNTGWPETHTGQTKDA